jgi:hypothetical protein
MLLKTKILLLKVLEILSKLCKRCCFPAEDKKKSDVHESICELLLQNDQFEETNFLNEVLDNPDLILSLKIQSG